MYFGVVSSNKIFFSCISKSSISKTKLGKTSLCTQLKQTSLENRLHISAESPEDGFNDTMSCG